MKYEIDIIDYLNIYKREWKRMCYLIAIGEAGIYSEIFSRIAVGVGIIAALN